MCYRPITIKNPATGEFMQVPCGKCLDCLRKYQNGWSIRMYEEYKSKGCKGVFFTLTYDEQHVPKNYLVDGMIFRSSPDYGFGNVHPNSGESGYGIPKGQKGVRKKYAEAPHAVLSRAGVLRDDVFEPNQEILDFNVRRSPSKHRKLLERLTHLFADYFALIVPPLSVMRAVKSKPEECDLEGFITLDCITDDVCKSWKVDEETGELSPKSTYDSPIASVMDYRERPIISFNSVRKEDVQLWIRRNRTRWNREHENRLFSYFITSEYGPTTLRPHYHGCLFGVSKDEVRDWFKDWQEHYGVIVDYDDLDMSKGGLSYVSKYCSKGSFEHPLCAKDFFYFYHKAKDYNDVICSEYHSKHYEKCIQWFGVDAPIVDPTFHLVSKGLGKDWCEKDVPRCKEFDDFFVHTPEILPSDVYDFDSFIEGEIDVVSLISSHEDYLKRKKENEEKWLAWSQHEQTMESWLECFHERCKYVRHFVSSEGSKVFAYSLPKYYREKMFSPALRSTYSNYVRSCMDKDYNEKLRQLVSDESFGESIEASLALEAEARQQVIDRYNSAFEKFNKFYKKSKL